MATEIGTACNRVSTQIKDSQAGLGDRAKLFDFVLAQVNSLEELESIWSLLEEINRLNVVCTGIKHKQVSEAAYG